MLFSLDNIRFSSYTIMLSVTINRFIFFFWILMIVLIIFYWDKIGTLQHFRCTTLLFNICVHYREINTKILLTTYHHALKPLSSILPNPKSLSVIFLLSFLWSPVQCLIEVVIVACILFLILCLKKTQLLIVNSLWVGCFL